MAVLRRRSVFVMEKLETPIAFTRPFLCNSSMPYVMVQVYLKPYTVHGSGCFGGTKFFAGRQSIVNLRALTSILTFSFPNFNFPILTLSPSNFNSSSHLPCLCCTLGVISHHFVLRHFTEVNCISHWPMKIEVKIDVVQLKLLQHLLTTRQNVLTSMCRTSGGKERIA